MTSENFTYWLQGYLELSLNNNGLSPTQVLIIQDHLDLVFNKVTPNRKPILDTLPQSEIDKFINRQIYCSPMKEKEDNKDNKEDKHYQSRTERLC